MLIDTRAHLKNVQMEQIFIWMVSDEDSFLGKQQLRNAPSSPQRYLITTREPQERGVRFELRWLGWVCLY